MRIAGMVQDSIVDGPGLRFTVFVQGCSHHCEGCHNPETHDPYKGKEISVQDIIEKMLSNPLTDGLTLSGGEPFEQAGDCARIAGAAKDAGLNVWTYSGCTFEALLKRSLTEPAVSELLQVTDILVDGPFVFSQRSLAVKWRGSKNQRIVSVKESLVSGVAVTAE